jgi:HK97 gp10 family phage protein
MSVKIEGLAGLQVKLEKFKDDAIKDIDAALAQGSEKIEEKAKRYAPEFDGLMRNSIFSDTTEFLKKKVVSPVFYSPFVEFGTKGKFNANGRQAIASIYKGQGKGGSFEQLVENMYNYLKKKGWPPEVRGEKAKQNYARFIAGKIAKGGIRPQPFFFRAYDEVRPVIMRLLKKYEKK